MACPIEPKPSLMGSAAAFSDSSAGAMHCLVPLSRLLCKPWLGHVATPLLD